MNLTKAYVDNSCAAVRISVGIHFDVSAPLPAIKVEKPHV